MVHEEDPPPPKAGWTGEEQDPSSREDINRLTKNIFTPLGKPTGCPPHPTNTCTVSPVKVAPSGGTPNHDHTRVPPISNTRGSKLLY